MTKNKCEVCDLQAELEATNRQVEILSDALAESRREVAALKAVQEPWGFHIQFNNGKDATFKGLNHLAECEAHLECGETITMIYTTPPAAQRQWVGLTDEQIEAIWYDHRDREMGYAMRFARAIEAKLKELNT